MPCYIAARCVLLWLLLLVMRSCYFCDSIAFFAMRCFSVLVLMLFGLCVGVSYVIFTYSRFSVKNQVFLIFSVQSDNFDCKIFGTSRMYVAVCYLPHMFSLIPVLFLQLITYIYGKVYCLAGSKFFKKSHPMRALDSGGWIWSKFIVGLTISLTKQK